MISRASDPDLDRDVLKKLIFLFSNRLEWGYDSRIPEDRGRVIHGLIFLMHSSGAFESPLALSSLGWTFSSFVEKLFCYVLKGAVAENDAQATEVLRWLLASGLNPNSLAFDPAYPYRRMYPLQYACYEGAFGIVRLLLRAKANANLVPPHCCGEYPREPIHLLLDYWKSARTAGNSQPSSSLHEAVRDLVSHGANVEPDTKSMMGEEPTPLMKAVSMADHGLIKILVENGASLLAKKNKSHRCSECGLAETWTVLSNAAGYRGAEKDDGAATELVKLTLQLLRQGYPDVPPEHFVDFDVILSAVEADNASALRFLYTQGFRIDLVHKDRYTALHAAASKGALEACKTLAECGVPINSLDAKAPSALHLACAGGHVEVVRFLYERAVMESDVAVLTASSRISREWISPLQAAIRRNSAPGAQLCALFLVQQGVHFSRLDFQEAFEMGYYRVVLAMLPRMDLSIQFDFAKGSESKYRSTLEECIGRSMEFGIIHPFADPIELGLKLGNWNLIKHCLATGVSWHGPSTTGASYLEIALLTGETDLISSSFNMDPFLYDSGALCAAVALAARSNDHLWVELLLKNRRSGSAMDKFEGTALAIAIYNVDYDLVTLMHRSIQPAFVALFPRLIPDSTDDPLSELSVFIGTLETTTNDVRMIQDILRESRPFWRSDDAVDASPLAAGIASRDPDMVHHLVALGIPADRFCLSVASCINSDGMISAIAEAYSDGPAPSERLACYTPVYWAVHNGNAPMVRRLVEMGENLNFPVDVADVNWKSYLQIAAASGTLEMVETLVELGMDVNEPVEKEGPGTCLQIAAELGSLPITRRLLDHGADVNAPGDPNRGPALVRAAMLSRIDVIHLLLNEGEEIKGRDRETYRKAVKTALLRGLYVTANLLWAQFGWTSEDRRWLKVNLLPKPHIPLHHPENLWKNFVASAENKDTENYENGRESSGKCGRSDGRPTDDDKCSCCRRRAHQSHHQWNKS